MEVDILQRETKVLFDEINKLKERISILEKNKMLIPAALKDIWDNEYDAVWDNI